MKFISLFAPVLACLQRQWPLKHHFKPLRRGSTVLLLGTALSLNALSQQAPQLQLPRTKLNAGMHMLDVQLAQTPEQRQIGLMWRKEMPQHEGMLFVFEQAAPQCFWMRNTLIPLSAAFLADDGTIVLRKTRPLCSGNERGLVCQASTQSRLPTGRHGFQALSKLFLSLKRPTSNRHCRSHTV
jgi:uncharacterized membrane protein (UPF0127 family)